MTTTIRHEARSWDLVRFLPVMLAALSAGAAGIHGSVITEHADESWLFGVFFAASGGLQLLWAYLVLVRPSPFLYAAGAAGNAAVVLLWVASRTAGLPLGPDAGAPEAASYADSLATLLEVGVVLGCVAVLRPRLLDRFRGRRDPYLAAVSATVALGAAVAIAMALEASREGPLPAAEPSGVSLLSAHGLHLLLIVAVVAGYAGYRAVRRFLVRPRLATAS